MRGRAVVASTREAELLSGALAASIEIERATAELYQACDTISTQSKLFAKIVHWKTSIKNVEDNVAFHIASKKNVKTELAAATTNKTRLGQLYDNAPAKVADLQERLGVRGVVIQFIVEDSCATFGPSPMSLVENFCASLNESVSEAFRASAGSIGSQFHVDAAGDGITRYFLEGSASDNENCSTKGKTVLIPWLTPRSLSCSWCFSFRSQLVNCFCCSCRISRYLS